MKLKTVVVDGKTYAEVNDQGLPLYRCSIQFNYLAKGLDDIFERDENNVQEKILLDLKKSNKTRFAQTTLPKDGGQRPVAGLFRWGGIRLIYGCAIISSGSLGLIRPAGRGYN